MNKKIVFITALIIVLSFLLGVIFRVDLLVMQ